MFHTKTSTSLLFALLTSIASATSAATWTIQPDSSGDFPTIQDAISAAVVDSGDFIVLTEGTYTGSGNTNVDFEGKAVTVCSELGPEATIIDCESIAGGFIFQSGEGPTSVVTGVTIKNGRANFYGGAVYCKSSSPQIIGNIFKSNQSGFQGGGVYCDSSNAVIQGNRFGGSELDDVNKAPQGGALWCSGGSTLLVEGNRFEGNQASEYGGALACDASSALVRRNTFIGNVALDLGGAVAMTSGAEGTIVDNVFEANGLAGGNIVCAVGGAIGCRQSPPSTVIEGNVFVGNGAVCGGGVCFEFNSLGALRNNTFDENKAGVGAGVFCTDFSDPHIEFNIIVGSPQGLPIETANSSLPEVRCCDLFGNADGDTLPPDVYDTGGNISLDPQFCGGQGTGNYYLLATSPCLPGNQGTECDTIIGARPLGCTVIVGIDDDVPPGNHRLLENYPNPFTAMTTIRYEVVSEPARIRVAVFDVAGRRVRILTDALAPVGRGEVIWDGRDEVGRTVSSGVYFCRLSATGHETVRKMVLLK